MNSPFIINLMYFERMKKTENKKENITSEITENQSDSNKNTNFLNFLTVDNMIKYVNF